MPRLSTVDEFFGPEAPQPPPVQCSKCWAECPCVWWEEFPRSPFADKSRHQLYKCPSHNYFELIDGAQVFDDADCWVTGPDGKPMRLFER